MRQWLAEQIRSFDKSSRVLELFCGSGNFTEVLAEHFTTIVAVDSTEAAIVALQAKGLASVTAQVENLYQPLVFERLHQQGPFDILLLDPPRDGLKNTQNLCRNKRPFKAIFYISCDLATFCRDCEWFSERGYRLDLVQPVDQAPQTPHIELLARLSPR